MSMFGLKLAFAGLGHMVAHWSIGIIIIATVVALEFGAGTIIAYVPLLAKPIAWVQKYLLFIGVGTGLLLAGEWLGARDMAARCDAKAAVVVKEVHRVVIDANSNKSKRLDKWDTNQ